MATPKMISSSVNAWSKSFSAASIINADKKSSARVERRRFLMILSLLKAL